MLTQHGKVMSITITARLSPHTRQPASHPAPARSSSSNATRTRPHTDSADTSHTFAVVTLEQLQRGHIAGQADRNTEQRRTYSLVFGDPLDWVRRRLGHRSVVTTQVYLHALAELEMETRMLLVPGDWEDPRDTPLDQFDGHSGEFTGTPA
jgi:integrase